MPNHAASSIQCVKDACNVRAPLSTNSDKSLTLVLFYMNIMKVEAAGIVDDRNCCIGFITSDDVVDHLCDNIPDTSVKDIMRQPSMTVYLDDPIEKALIMMKTHQIDWLPVIDFNTQQFCALIYRKDIKSTPLNIIPFLKRRYQICGSFQLKPAHDAMGSSYPRGHTAL